LISPGESIRKKKKEKKERDLALRIPVVLLLQSLLFGAEILLKVPGAVVDMEARSGLAWF